MNRFFITRENRKDDAHIVLTGENFHHFTRVLRARIGEKTVACDGCGTDYYCTVEQIDREQAILRIDSAEPSAGESRLKVTLFQCLPKGDKMEQIIKRTVEMGVYRIVPVISKFCIAKASEGGHKSERYQKIAVSAAQQSGRGIIPVVEQPVSFEQAVQQLCKLENSFVCYENEKQVSFGDFEIKGDSTSFLIGPEGGLAPEEAELWQSAGIPAVTLGRRILRTENAAAFVLPILYYKTHNL